MAQKQELPVEKVSRLSRELSVALDEWGEGEYMAVILPSSRANGLPVMFGNIDEQRKSIDCQAGRAA